MISIYKDPDTLLLAIEIGHSDQHIIVMPEILDHSKNGVYAVEHRLGLREALPSGVLMEASINQKQVGMLEYCIQSGNSSFKQWALVAYTAEGERICISTDNIAGEWRIESLNEFMIAQTDSAFSCHGELNVTMKTKLEIEALRQQLV